MRRRRRRAAGGGRRAAGGGRWSGAATVRGAGARALGCGLGGQHDAGTLASGGGGGRGAGAGPGGSARGAALVACRAAAEAAARGALLPVAGDLHRGPAAGRGARALGAPRGLPVQPAPRRELAEPPAARSAGRPCQPRALPLRLLQPAAGPGRAAAAPARRACPRHHRLRLHGPQRLADRSAPQGRYPGSTRPGPGLHAPQVCHSGQEGADHRLPQLDHTSHSEQSGERFDYGGRRLCAAFPGGIRAHLGRVQPCKVHLFPTEEEESLKPCSHLSWSRRGGLMPELLVPPVETRPNLQGPDRGWPVCLLELLRCHVRLCVLLEINLNMRKNHSDLILLHYDTDRTRCSGLTREGLLPC